MIDRLYFKVDDWSIKIGQINKPYSENNEIYKNSEFTTHLKADHVTDRDAMFIADPFLINHNKKTYCFYEILDNKSYKGVIGYSKSLDGLNWEYGKVCLEEKWHLSYPYLVKDNENIYMIPESSKANSIILYKASDFPDKWQKICELAEGNYVDSSIIFHNGKWWLFTTKDNYPNYNLDVFYADKIEGPWIEHKKNPIIKNNANITRSGGRVLNIGSRLIRHAQDCKESYGRLVRAFEVTKLTEDEYEEKELGIVIENSNKELSWNRDGMHNIDLLKVDGETYNIAVDGYYCKNVNILTNKIKSILNMKSY